MLDSDKPWTISKQQRLSLRDPGIKGRMWVSKVQLAAPTEDDVYIAVERAIHGLGTGDKTFDRPDIKPVEAEWIGFRPGAEKNASRPEQSEADQYSCLMRDVKSDVTILYMHGGALYLMDPATHRVPNSILARLTGGRCLSIRYRLAPQNPFPAALLDVLVAYISLLSPPPGALHEAVPASKIVFAGDSAGGNLSLVLLQLLLQLHRTANGVPSIRFHGRDVAVPIPAGVALNSPWADLTGCMPSMTTNLKFDYIPKTSPERYLAIPACTIWPTKPPRQDLYCDMSTMLHPLVSPLAARDWKGSCPVQFSYGTEVLTDEAKAVAARMAKQGVPVEAWEWETMPHVFAQVLQSHEGAKKMYQKWASFIQAAVAGRKIDSRAMLVKARSLNEIREEVTNISPYSIEQVDSMMRTSWQRKLDLGVGGNERLTARL